MFNKISPALKVAIIYLTFSLIWIFTSDSVVASIAQDKETLNFLQTIKGWIFVSATSLLIFLLTNKYLKAEKKLHDNLQVKSKELENIIQNSPVPMVVLNENGEFSIINKMWLELTGYDFEEINTLDKWTNRAYRDNAKSRKASIQKLFEIEGIDDNGEFTIHTKEDKEVVWHFYTSFLGFKNGKRQLIATAIDVTELKNKNKLIIQQSKMAALGEMIENIAHQWRQPLSSISTLATGIELKEEFGKIDKKEIVEAMQTINDNSQYLSNTIDDFRSFFDKEKTKRYFKVDSTIKKALALIKPRVINHDINVITFIDKIEIESYENELIQVLINILNNAIDILKENDEEKIIHIKTEVIEDFLIITIKDSGKGLKEEVLNKLFEPYFTTKHKSQGTGIGLFMSEEIVSKHMNGSIEAENSEFTHDEKEYKGASFKIRLPLR